LTAHVDTGNQAETVFSAKIFDFLFPLTEGSKTERCGLQYKGLAKITGVTGHTKVLQRYSGVKVKFDGVASRQGKILEFQGLNVMRGHDNTDSPGKNGYHDLLVSARDMQLLLEVYGHTIAVVDYELFKRSCNCKLYH